MKTLELPETQLWTPEALERLSPEFRYEVREGNLTIMPAAMRPWHADTQRRLVQLLVGQGKPAYIEQGVILSGNEIRTCDVGVFTTPPIGGAAYHPVSEFALLVEVVSGDLRHQDREVNPRLYAAGGVPVFWRVEEGEDGEPIVFQHALARLADGSATYVESRVMTLTDLEAG